MSILMTGSTGHIGSQVIQYLAGKGAEVSALTRSPERARFPAGIAAHDQLYPSTATFELTGLSSMLETNDAKGLQRSFL